MATKQEWLAQRRFRITASDVPVIMGCAPFRGRGIAKKTTEDLIKEKLSGERTEPNLAMLCGKLYEPAHLELLRDCGLNCVGNEDLRVKDDWLGATVDGYIEDLKSYEPRGLVPWSGFPVFNHDNGILEMKNTSRTLTGEAPEDYWWQLQCGLHVHAGSNSGVLMVKSGANKAMLYPVEYDEVACQEMEKECKKVYEELCYRREHP